MEQNRQSARSRNADSSASDDALGAFEVGDEIREQGDGAARPDVAAVTGAEAKSSDALVIGDNSGVQGDADDMTSGDSAEHTPDDTAHRPMGLGSASGADDVTGRISK